MSLVQVFATGLEGIGLAEVRKKIAKAFGIESEEVEVFSTNCNGTKNLKVLLKINCELFIPPPNCRSVLNAEFKDYHIEVVLNEMRVIYNNPVV